MDAVFFLNIQMKYKAYARVITMTSHIIEPECAVVDHLATLPRIIQVMRFHSQRNRRNEGKEGEGGNQRSTEVPSVEVAPRTKENHMQVHEL